MSTLPNEVREAIIDGLVKSATEARDCINEIRGIKIDRPVSRSIFQKDADAALSALEAAGWVCVPVRPLKIVLGALEDEHGFEPQDVRCNACRAQAELRALLTASNPKEKPDV